MPHFSTESQLILAAVILTAGLVLHRLLQWRKKRKEIDWDDWAREDKKNKAYDGEKYARQVREWARESRSRTPVSTPGHGSLPSEEARTQAMAKLGAEVSAAISKDPDETARLRAARQSARAGNLHPRHSDEPEYGWATREHVRSDIPRTHGLMSGYPVGGVSRELEVSDAI